MGPKPFDLAAQGFGDDVWCVCDLCGERIREGFELPSGVPYCQRCWKGDDGMGMTMDQAKAFFAACLKSATVRASCEAVLGYNKLPEIDYYDSNEAALIDRWEELLLHVEACSQVLIAGLEGRPRQKELPLEPGNGAGEKPKAEKPRRRRKAAAVAE